MEKRLQTVLAHAGIASRRRAACLIEKGKVRINGRIVREKGYRVDPAVCEITVDGRALAEKEKKYYFLFNKPAGVITTVRDTHGRIKVLDYFKEIKERLYPVGRLDKDTTGLLLITNDGELTHKLTHPKFMIEKEYIAVVGGSIKDSDLRRIEKGVMLEEARTAPCRIRVIDEKDGATTFSIKVHEGRKRQIKRMFGTVGGRVVSLKRVRYAGFTIGKLREGEFRPLSGQEIEKLKRLF